jgi:hypothetical protein
MITKLLIKAFALITYVLLTITYFVWIYSEVGLLITTECLITWSTGFLAYTIAMVVAKFCIEEFTDLF